MTTEERVMRPTPIDREALKHEFDMHEQADPDRQRGRQRRTSTRTANRVAFALVLVALIVLALVALFF